MEKHTSRANFKFLKGLNFRLPCKWQFVLEESETNRPLYSFTCWKTNIIFLKQEVWSNSSVKSYKYQQQANIFYFLFKYYNAFSFWRFFPPMAYSNNRLTFSSISFIVIAMDLGLCQQQILARISWHSLMNLVKEYLIDQLHIVHVVIEHIHITGVIK